MDRLSRVLASNRFRCDECRCVLRYNDEVIDGVTYEGQAAADCGSSHWFCDRCLTRLEDREAIIAARYERRGHLLSSTAVFFLAHGEC